MTPPPRRIARVVLTTAEGHLIGALPPVPVATPWWQDVAPVIEAMRAAHGVEITVLRLLEVADPTPAGIEITYLAETAARPDAEPWAGALEDHPLRLSYARPGGPAADLAWAQEVLASRGAPLDGPAAQVRTWNLSSLWRLRAGGEAFWLKVVPPFLAHEGALLEALAGGPVPTLVARDGGRILMREIAGEDRYGARANVLTRMISLIVRLQAAWAGRTRDLTVLGLPDGRGVALSLAIEQVVSRTAGQLDAEERRRLAGFLATLPYRLAEVAACGLPETLVHGDFHPGNLRGAGEGLTLLDWGDSFVGHPLLDQPAFLDRICGDDVEAAREAWALAWRAAAPGSDPARASALLAPVAAARQAAVYQGFLDRIEPSEHAYHRHDPVERLRRLVQLLREEKSG